MRWAVLGVLVMVGCAKTPKEQVQPTPDTIAAAPEVAGTEPAVVDAAAAAGRIDCDALLTAADFQTVCKAAVEISRLPNEGDDRMFSVCSRRIAMGGAFPFGNFILNVYASAEAAEMLWTAEGEGVQDLPGVGDRAWSLERGAGDVVDAWVKVRKGRVGFWLRAHSEPGVTSPCTLAHLAELAKLAAGRLP
jgi:hypothetical protein